jgi:hypothetical protein
LTGNVSGDGNVAGSAIVAGLQSMFEELTSYFVPGAPCVLNYIRCNAMHTRRLMARCAELKDRG